MIAYWHGGGFVVADLDVYDASPRALAEEILPKLPDADGRSLVATILGTMISFALVRYRFRGRSVLLALITVPFVLPTVVVPHEHVYDKDGVQGAKFYLTNNFNE